MNETRRVQVLSGVLLVLAIVAVAVWYSYRPGEKPPPSEPGYYTGPMKSKGDPTIFGTDAGQRVAAPPEATKSPAPANRTAAKGGSAAAAAGPP